MSVRAELSAGSADAHAAAGRHALIIEDDLITGLDLQAMLQGLGFSSFAFASTSDQAAEQARLRTPDLATIDLGLLDGDGVAAARAVRGLCGEAALVFITGDPDSVRDQMPGTDVLAKPVTPLDLARVLARSAVAGRG